MTESVTQLLGAWRSGDDNALEQLTPLVYNELRRLAGRYMQSERAGHTLQATAVVNEAFMRMVDMDVPWQNRAHFFAIAARLMRRILVDHAKAHRREKRGGKFTDLTLDEGLVEQYELDKMQGPKETIPVERAMELLLEEDAETSAEPVTEELAPPHSDVPNP